MDQMEDTGEDQLFQTPILFLIFNRPDTTKMVFEVIRSVRPTKLFIAADGPREGRAGEAEKCEQARSVISQIDWPCDVHTLFRDENLGCGRAVSSAITWYFEHVTEGIILEDDTLPSADFFRFCAELLVRYRDDTRIMEISGSCLPSPRVEANQYSYFFSNWDYIWGWATWKRAWKHYDYSMKRYEEAVAQKCFHEHYTSLYEGYFMKHSFDRSYYQSNHVTWWSYQWGFARKINSGLVVVPTRNMVVNVGLGRGATNTTTSRWDFLQLEKMDFPLMHPHIIMHNRMTDDEVFRKHFTSSFSRIKQQVRRGLEYLGLSEKNKLAARAQKEGMGQGKRSEN
jgi:hypothetical protein